MNKQRVRNLVIVTLAVFTLLVSTFVGIKFVHTSVQLEVLASKIRSTEHTAYTSQSGWSDKAISSYTSLQEKRAEYTESSDDLVRWFSNQHKVIKLLALCLTFVTFIFALALICSYISYKYKHICKKMRKNHYIAK